MSQGSGDRGELQGRPADGASLWAAVLDRGYVEDAVAIVLVPLLLAAVFTLPESTRATLALAYDDPTAITAYASHFVHFDLDHLLVNIGGYLIVVPVAYVLSVSAGRRRQFFVVFAAFVVGLPLALSALNLIFARPRIGVGFSGILLAFVGYLPVAILGVAGPRLRVPVSRRRSQWLFFLGLGVIALISGPTPYNWGLAVAAGLASILFLLPVVRDWDDATHPRLRYALRHEGHVEMLLAGLLVFLGYLFVAFPEGGTQQGTVVDVYSHLLGYSLGYVTTHLMVLAGGFDVD